jgi:hypothetical protein
MSFAINRPENAIILVEDDFNDNILDASK